MSRDRNTRKKYHTEKNVNTAKVDINHRRQLREREARVCVMCCIMFNGHHREPLSTCSLRRLGGDLKVTAKRHWNDFEAFGF